MVLRIFILSSGIEQERERVCERAYYLALYILGDFELAERVATKVADTLDSQYQLERERRSSFNSVIWYKICPNKDFMLNRLTFVYTCAGEQQQEQAYWNGQRHLDEETMTIRFIKEIIDHGFTHNTFHLLVGRLRVLFNYSTKESQQLYDILVPDGTGGRDADAYRRSKKRLIGRLEKRLNELIQVVNVHGENRFLKREDAGDNIWLVEECLNNFTPLNPRCPKLPDKINSTTDVIGAFESQTPTHPQTASAERKEEEHTVELVRMHALTHTPCASNLIGLLEMPQPEQRLELPIFFLSQHGGGIGPPPIDRRNIPPLSPDQKKRMQLALRQLQERRDRLPLNEVTVALDDVELGVLRLDGCRQIQMELEAGTRIIEFRSRDEFGSLHLGVHLLSWNRELVTGKPEVYRISLKGRRQIAFSITYLKDADGEPTHARVDLAYSKARSKWTLPFAVGAFLLTAAASASFIYYRYNRRVRLNDQATLQ
jgi:hypothetical protein